MWLFLSLGGGISRILLIAWRGGSLKNGGSPSTISITMMPKDQTSTSGPYGSREMTSGAIQYGVPTKDFLFGSSWETWAQNPKSDNLTCKKTKQLVLKILYSYSKITYNTITPPTTTVNFHIFFYLFQYFFQFLEFRHKKRHRYSLFHHWPGE